MHQHLRVNTTSSRHCISSTYAKSALFVLNCHDIQISQWVYMLTVVLAQLSKKKILLTHTHTHIEGKKNPLAHEQKEQ